MRGLGRYLVTLALVLGAILLLWLIGRHEGEDPSAPVRARGDYSYRSATMGSTRVALRAGR